MIDHELICKSYEDRLLSLKRAIEYFLQYSDLSDSKKYAIQNNINALYLSEKEQLKIIYEKFSRKIQADLLKDNLFDYLTQLQNISGIKTKDILLAEAFNVWQTRIQHPIITHTAHRSYAGETLSIDEVIIQAPLTQAQKDEFIKIHLSNKDQPKWFKALPLWAQNALKEIVPKNSDVNSLAWNKVEQWRPTQLRHIPGQANSTIHSFEITIDGQKVTTKAFRQGVPTAYEMKDDSERQDSATENSRQLLNYLFVPAPEEKVSIAKKDFCQYWGLNESTQIPTPVTTVSLLTPLEGSISILGRIKNWVDGKEDNDKLTREKNTAIHRLISDGTLKDTQVFNVAIGVNWFRKTDYVPPEEKAFIKSARGFLDKLIEHKIDAADVKLVALNAAINTLENTPAKPVSGRNESMYRAAMYDVITRLMGGVSIGNCKSSKDRKGTELIMADSILAYYAKYKSFPKLNDQGYARKNFIKIFADIYSSQHHQKVSSQNIPGCLGLKDESGLIDNDIKKALGEDYKWSKKFAGMNKPGTWPQINPKKTLAMAMLAPIGIIGGVGVGVMGFAALVGTPVGWGILAFAAIATLYSTYKGHRKSVVHKISDVISEHNTLADNVGPPVSPSSTSASLLAFQREPNIKADRANFISDDKDALKDEKPIPATQINNSKFPEPKVLAASELTENKPPKLG